MVLGLLFLSLHGLRQGLELGEALIVVLLPHGLPDRWNWLFIIGVHWERSLATKAQDVLLGELLVRVGFSLCCGILVTTCFHAGNDRSPLLDG